MPLWLTEDAVLRCDHAGSGKVKGFNPAQRWVRIERRRVLIRPDPERRSFDQGCIMKPPQFKPCGLTLAVTSGYSSLVRIDGHPVCLGTVTGMTEGFPPAPYRVHDPAQRLVGAGV